MYNEASGNNNGANVSCSFEGTDNSQSSKITFQSKRFSPGYPNLRAMGRFRVAVLIDNVWEAKDFFKNIRTIVLYQRSGTY